MKIKTEKFGKNSEKNALNGTIPIPSRFNRFKPNEVMLRFFTARSI